MKLMGIGVPLAASLGFAQDSSDFKPAISNVLDAPYPKVDGNSRVQIRFKAPDAIKVKLNFWSGPKADMEKFSTCNTAEERTRAAGYGRVRPISSSIT